MTRDTQGEHQVLKCRLLLEKYWPPGESLRPCRRGNDASPTFQTRALPARETFAQSAVLVSGVPCLVPRAVSVGPGPLRREKAPGGRPRAGRERSSGSGGEPRARGSPSRLLRAPPLPTFAVRRLLRCVRGDRSASGGEIGFCQRAFIVVGLVFEN